MTFVTPYGTKHKTFYDAAAAACFKHTAPNCSGCAIESADWHGLATCEQYVKKFPEEAAKLLGIETIFDITDSGNRTPMGDTGFVRDAHADKGRMDLLPWNAMLDLSRHCEAGARKYGERNIDKGAPLHSLLDSGARHLAKYIAGQQDEDHLVAACWNLMWALEQRTTHPELNDMPWACNDM